MKELVKAEFILLAYIGLAPLLGLLIRERRHAQRWLFALMVFMTSWHINKITLMLASTEAYRGHTRGFEFSFLDVIAIALLVASTRQRTTRWLAPGAGLYMLFVALASLSIFSALNSLYVAMASLRFAKAVLVYLAAYHFLREEKDLAFFLRTLVFTLCVQAVVVLGMKYIGHVYQVAGWFEHQNSLSMWAYLCGLPLLGAALGPTDRKDTLWYSAGFVAVAIILESALSRGALAAFAGGTVLIVCLSLVERATLKRVAMTTCLALMAAAGLALSLHTLILRFTEKRNQASGDVRIAMNKCASAMLHDSLTGIGWNNCALAMNPPYPYGDAVDAWDASRGYKLNLAEVKGQVESLYWLLLSETGYPGTAAYVLFITVIGWWCLRSLWVFRRTFTASVLIGIAVALLATYLQSNLEHTLIETKNLYTWLIWLGLLARISTWAKSPGGGSPVLPYSTRSLEHCL